MSRPTLPRLILVIAMRFLVHVLKWCLAVLFALVPTVFVGGILSAISLIFIDEPPYGSAARSVEASNLRQIGQASLIYASDHHDRLPDAVDVPDYARLLAIDGGLNDISIWFPTGTTFGPDAWTVLQDLPGQPRARWPTNPAFAHAQPLFTVVLGGLDANMPSTTPLAWTRGLDLETGRWRPDSPYGGEGGHIVSLGGNVTFHRSLQNSAGGELVSRDGRPTHRIRDALPPDARIAPDPGPPPPGPALGQTLRAALHAIPPLVRAAILWAWPLWMLALCAKLALGIVRTWGVPVARVRIELRPRWLVLTPVALIVLSVVFQV